MSFKSNVPLYTFSDLEKLLQEITRLQKENISLLFEMEETRRKCEERLHLAQIESKVYSGIKKFFK